MIPSIAEYVGLRLVRRFVVRDALLARVQRWLPYYAVNQGEVSAAPIVARYEAFLGRVGATLAGKVVVELGAGATNSACHELVARGAARAIAVEPYARFRPDDDARALAAAAARAGVEPASIRARVVRVKDAADVVAAGERADLVLSNSVLEHVRDPDRLLADLDRLLAPDGRMLHLVDYRDHFFKYPYHFLLFRRATWERWLDPGDLPRWRLGDHLQAFARRGFTVTVLESERDDAAFAPLRSRLSADFDASDPTVAVTRAVFAASR